MKKVKAIGLEDTDDIRIVLKDDTNIYAQAKSSLGGNRLYKDSHLTTDIKESMKTLYENRNNNTYKLISIFNYRNPFGDPASGDGFTKTSPYNLVVREFTKVYDAFPNMPNHSLSFGYPARQVLNPQVYYSSTFLYSMYSIDDYVNEYNNVFWLDVITDVDVELSIFVDGSFIHTTTQRTPDIIKHHEMHEYMRTPLASFNREYLTDGEFDGI